MQTSGKISRKKAFALAYLKVLCLSLRSEGVCHLFNWPKLEETPWSEFTEEEHIAAEIGLMGSLVATELGAGATITRSYAIVYGYTGERETQ